MLRWASLCTEPELTVAFYWGFVAVPQVSYLLSTSPSPVRNIQPDLRVLKGKCRKCFSVTVMPKAILNPGHPIPQHSFAVCQLACSSSWLLSLLISCLLLWTYDLAQSCESVIRPQRREELLWLNPIWNDYLAIWTLNIQNIQMPAFDLIAITWPQESINYK